MITTRSSSGIRAKSPTWWDKLVSAIPELHLPILEPKEWTPEIAEAWIKRVPPKCPFERQFWWGNTLIMFVPALCPLNPFSAQLYGLRLKALTYLGENC